ncbi:MAG: hypothetical protein OXD46_13045, partial [Chloroflexi bacterium]|nr:hypothetical protein [Chloroflexota bacterium]
LSKQQILKRIEDIAQGNFETAAGGAVELKALSKLLDQFANEGGGDAAAARRWLSDLAGTGDS